MNLIVGGTHGLGGEITKQLQLSGEETFAVGRSYNTAEHGNGMTVDLADRQNVEKLTDYITEQIGKKALQRFFWVAGYGYVGDFADQPDVQRMVDVNFANVMPVAQKVWRDMTSYEGSTNFVVVSSTTGFRARTDQAVYAATKHAQVGFTRSLGEECKRLDLGVKVALFEPGGMKTPFWDEQQPTQYEGFLDPAKVAARICERVVEQQDHFYEEAIERGSI